MGGYELIYPLEDVPANKEMREQYESFLAKSQSIYDNFNIGKGRKIRPHNDNPASEKRTMPNGQSGKNEASTRMNHRAGA